MAVQALRQYIEFNGNLLPISKGMNYETAIAHYSTGYPALTNAVKDTQRTEEGKFIIKVKTAIGQKG